MLTEQHTQVSELGGACMYGSPLLQEQCTEVSELGGGMCQWSSARHEMGLVGARMDGTPTSMLMQQQTRWMNLVRACVDGTPVLIKQCTQVDDLGGSMFGWTIYLIELSMMQVCLGNMLVARYTKVGSLNLSVSDHHFQNSHRKLMYYFLGSGYLQNEDFCIKSGLFQNKCSVRWVPSA